MPSPTPPVSCTSDYQKDVFSVASCSLLINLS